MDNTIIKKFQFGVGLGEIVNEGLAIEQMRARNFLRNALVELDRKTRESYNAILNASNPSHDRIQLINAEIVTLRDAIKMKRVPVAGEKSGKHRVKVGPCIEKDQIAALKKERADLKPIADARRTANKANSKEALAALNEERRVAVNALYNRAVAGYTHIFPANPERKTVEHSVVVPALYNLNAGEICDQHKTERSRAMKDKTQLRFHRFEGEGRTFVSVHSKRDFSVEGSEELFAQFMETIGGLKAKRKVASQNKQTELAKRLLAEIEFQETTMETSIPNIIGQTQEKTFDGTSTLFTIEPVESLKRDANNPTVWDKSIDRAARRRAMRTVAHIRIQSDAKGKPVFLSLPVVMHRPLPVEAKILSAAVNREKIGRKFRWNVEFTVRYTEVRRDGEGTVAVDIGWAKDSLPLPDGRIRVAGIRERDANGVESFTEFSLPKEFTERTAYLDGIQATRDKHTNACFAAIAEYREHNEIADVELRHLLDAAKRSLSARKGGEPPVWHLRKAVWMLRNKASQDAQNPETSVPAEGGQDFTSGGCTSTSGLQTILETWYERYMHLNEWLMNGRDNVLAWKKDYYRRFAHDFASRNKTLLLDADNFAKMAKTPDAETDKAAMKNELRHGVAPAVLRSALEAAFGMTMWSSLASSKTCRKCWSKDNVLGAGREFKCSACGHSDDRESNATGNIMDEFLRKPGSFSTKKPVAAKLAETKAAAAAAAD